MDNVSCNLEILICTVLNLYSGVYLLLDFFFSPLIPDVHMRLTFLTRMSPLTRINDFFGVSESVRRRECSSSLTYILEHV